jgi:methoxymalonate biosynthesis protein
MLKLVIWDLDETILTGILEEGNQSIDPAAGELLDRLRGRGSLQALATHNQPEMLLPVVQKFQWAGLFVRTEANLGPKARTVRRILRDLDVSPSDAAFIDTDPFERDSITFQVPGITAWSIPELRAYLDSHPVSVTEEGARRPEMYLEQQARSRDEEATGDYEEFLRRCGIRIRIRPFVSTDRARAKELLARTHRMNLGVLSLEEAVGRLEHAGSSTVVAEMTDSYGDMGRCAVVHLSPNAAGGADMESLAISCRTRARGLALSMLVGLLRHPRNTFELVRCRYVFNGMNRPLRMLLMAAGFKSQTGTEQLVLSAEQLARTELPDWVHISHS